MYIFVQKTKILQFPRRVLLYFLSGLLSVPRDTIIHSRLSGKSFETDFPRHLPRRIRPFVAEN